MYRIFYTKVSPTVYNKPHRSRGSLEVFYDSYYNTKAANKIPTTSYYVVMRCCLLLGHRYRDPCRASLCLHRKPTPSWTSQNKRLLIEAFRTVTNDWPHLRQKITPVGVAIISSIMNSSSRGMIPTATVATKAIGIPGGN